MTCGDATLVPDVPFPTSAVLGRVSEVQLRGVWTAVGPAAPRGRKAVMVRSVLTAATTGILQLSPAASRRFVTALQALERWLRRTGDVGSG